MGTIKKPKSIIRQVGWLLSSIIVLSVISISASLITVQSADGDAERINIAGSLRMLSMRIAIAYGNHLHHHPAVTPTLPEDDPLTWTIDEFEKRLHAPVFANASFPDSNAQAEQLAALKTRWLEIRQLLIDHQPSAAEIEVIMQTYVESIDHFVTLIEHASEAKITRLQWIHSGGLASILLVSALLLLLLSNRVISPLDELRNGAKLASDGNLAVRIEYQSADELGELAGAFNHMAAELEQMYQNLGARVDEKTRELYQRNQALEFLNEAATSVTFSPNSRKTLLALMQTCLRVSGLQQIRFVGFDETQPDCRLVLSVTHASSGMTVDQWPSENSSLPEALIPTELTQRAFWEDKHLVMPFPHNQTDFFPLMDNERLVAVFIYDAQPDSPLLSWQRQLMHTFSDIVSKSFNRVSAQSQQQRFLLFEERAVIARELHDSIAQSLSYLKMQVSRFQVMLKKDVEKEKLELVANEIRTGINAAYVQLREVLTTFRIRLNEPGLEQALKSTLVELSGRSDTRISLEFGLKKYQPAVNEEIHILQIIREALTNVVKHAEAQHAWVEIIEQPRGDIRLTVQDDGRGLEAEYEKAFHHGITIMKERAAMLGGSLTLENNETTGVREGKGTTIQVTFRQTKQDADDLLILPITGAL